MRSGTCAQRLQREWRRWRKTVKLLYRWNINGYVVTSLELVVVTLQLF